MIKRIAFFAEKQEIENYFDFTTRKENLFESHYNISPGHYIPVVKGSNSSREISRIRWGEEANGPEGNKNTIESEKAAGELNKKGVSRCLIPLSGFFVWKESREKEHPFFVRMLNKPFMPVAGLCYEVNKTSFTKIVTTESNALIQPMSSEMPLMLDKELAGKWLNKEESTEEIMKDASSLFLLTDLSVVRVSKKVNNPSNNKPELIQPIPK